MKFLIFWQYLQKLHIYIIKDLDQEEILGEFAEKELTKKSD